MIKSPFILITVCFMVLCSQKLKAGPIVKVIKQSLINDFEAIVLFKLADLGQPLLSREAGEVVISLEQLSLPWQ